MPPNDRLLLPPGGFDPNDADADADANANANLARVRQISCLSPSLFIISALCLPPSSSQAFQELAK